MKKLLYLCSACFLVYSYASTAQASVRLLGGDGVTFEKKGGTTTTFEQCQEDEEFYGGRCVKKCNPKEFPFRNINALSPLKGKIEVCEGGIRRYKYESCYEDRGYVPQGVNCVAKDCSAYPLTESQIDRNIGHVEACTSAEETTYRYTDCNSVGWEFDADHIFCVPRSCVGYPYSGKGPIENKIGDTETIQSGDKWCWRYKNCYDPDMELISGICYKKCTGYSISEEETIDHCKKASYCANNNGNFHKCTQCESGYQPNTDGYCEAMTCPMGLFNMDEYWCSDAWRCLMPAN